MKFTKKKMRFKNWLSYLVVLPELGVVEIIEPVRHCPGAPILLNKLYATKLKTKKIKRGQPIDKKL